MMLHNVKSTGSALFMCGLIFTGVCVTAQEDSHAKKNDGPVAATSESPDRGSSTTESRPSQKPPSPSADKEDPPSDLATLKNALLKAVTSEWSHALNDFTSTNKGLEEGYQASRRLMAAQEQCVITPDEKASVVEAHFQRMRMLARAQRDGRASAGDIPSAQVRSYVAEAELWLAQAKAAAAKNKDDPNAEPQGNTVRRDQDAKSQLIFAKLDEPISMSFNEETPLEDVLKYVKQATTTKTYGGIPIYVDPVGLQEAEKSMKSTIRNIGLEGVALRRTLQLILNQIDLRYFVEDGLLYITSEESESYRLRSPMREPSPLELKLEKAERGELTMTQMVELAALLKTRQAIKKMQREYQTEEEEPGIPSLRTMVDAKDNKELIELLIKETRELVDILSADRQTKKPQR